MIAVTVRCEQLVNETEPVKVENRSRPLLESNATKSNQTEVEIVNKEEVLGPVNQTKWSFEANPTRLVKLAQLRGRLCPLLKNGEINCTSGESASIKIGSKFQRGFYIRWCIHGQATAKKETQFPSFFVKKKDVKSSPDRYLTLEYDNFKD